METAPRELGTRRKFALICSKHADPLRYIGGMRCLVLVTQGSEVHVLEDRLQPVRVEDRAQEAGCLFIYLVLETGFPLLNANLYN